MSRHTAICAPLGFQSALHVEAWPNDPSGPLPPWQAVIEGHDIGRDMDAVYALIGACPQHDLLWDGLTGAQGGARDKGGCVWHALARAVRARGAGSGRACGRRRDLAAMQWRRSWPHPNVPTQAAGTCFLWRTKLAPAGQAKTLGATPPLPLLHRPRAPAVLRAHQEPAGPRAAPRRGRRPARRQPVLCGRRPGGRLQVRGCAFAFACGRAWSVLCCARTGRLRAGCLALPNFAKCRTWPAQPGHPLLPPRQSPCPAHPQRRHEAAAQRGHFSGGGPCSGVLGRAQHW